MIDKLYKPFDRFDKSKCAEDWRNESGVMVSLWSLRGSRNTHFILVVYDNYEQMEKGRAIFSSCPASSRMIASFSKTTETTRSYNWVTENALSGRDWQTNSVFAKFNFSVERGKEILSNSGLEIVTAKDLEDAAEKAVSIVEK